MKTFVVKPNEDGSFEVKAERIYRSQNWIEFSTDTGVVAMIPSHLNVVEKSSLVLPA